MADIGLIKLLKDKYNTPINGEDCITFHHMQLVINTVKEKAQAELAAKDEAIAELVEMMERGRHELTCNIYNNGICSCGGVEYDALIAKNKGE